MANYHSRYKVALPSGVCLRQYSVESVLGVGGFGITYLAIDGDLQTQVAIKEYLPNEFAVREGEYARPKSPESEKAFQWGLSRFLQEGRELAKFRHANIVRVHQMFEANNTAYMVLDYEDGDTLEKWLRGLERKPTEEELRDFLFPLLDALEQMHDDELLHRDISPENIIIREDGAPVLLDFGSARYSTAAQSKSLSAVVKAGYSPPEQYSSRSRQGAFTDIYALAATLYRAIMGKAPPEGSWRIAEVAAGDGDPLPSLQEDGYSYEFLTAIEKALAVSVSERPQSIEEWRDMLSLSSDTEEKTEEQDSFDFLSGPQDADSQYELGLKYCNGDGVEESIETAIKWWRKAAEQGHALAQYVIGGLYENGHHEPIVKQSYREAIKWYSRAAEQGHDSAQYSLGEMYKSGQGVKKNAQEAFKWFLKSAEQGHDEAQFNLGEMYHNGRGVEQNDQEAEKWILKAAERHNQEAVKWIIKVAEQGKASVQFILGWMYNCGLGVSRDYKDAVKWYQKSAEQGHVAAQSSLGWAYYYGNGVEQDRKEAAKWLQKSAEQGNAQDQNMLGWMYKVGKSIEQNDLEAAKWFLKAAEQKEVNSQYGLGEMYKSGRGVKQNDQEAITWYLKAAEQGHEEARCSLGEMYEKGRGVEQSDWEAVRWYRKATDQKYVNAKSYCRLGRMYESGRGLQLNVQEAVKYYLKAAEDGHRYAKSKLGKMHDELLLRATEEGSAQIQYALGKMYAEGWGVKPDEQATIKWYLSAAEQGNSYAQFAIGEIYAEGQDAEFNYQEIAKWYLKAAEQGHEDAQHNIGIMYEEGRGVEQSDRDAAKWYRKAEEQGVITGFRLDRIYRKHIKKAEKQDFSCDEYSLDVLQGAVRYYRKDVDSDDIFGGMAQTNIEILFKIYQKAAEQGNVSAQFNLGEMYEHGCEYEFDFWCAVKQDRQVAIKWYQKAAEQGHKHAKERLDLLRENKQGVE